jgi:hypothetical protein
MGLIVMTSWRDLPGPARAIGGAITAAVDAAREGDREAFVAAAGDVAALPSGQVGIMLGAVVRSLLEEQHPDGLDGDDIQLVLSRCFRDTVAWLPLETVDVHVLVAVLSSALGIHEPGVTYQEITGPAESTRGGDDWAGDPDVTSIGGDPATDGAIALRPPTAEAYAWHAPLLIADLLTVGRRPIGRYLDAAFSEIARSETMEMP